MSFHLPRRTWLVPLVMALLGCALSASTWRVFGNIWDEPEHIAAGICLLESTQYLRNQLLRDSDWASMAHSLELRTPLVDAALLHSLRSLHTGFTGGAGKRMLAQSPKSPLPDQIINRPKTGFAIPMVEWLAAATNRRDWNSVPLLSASGTPWTRRWARVVLDEGFHEAV